MATKCLKCKSKGLHYSIKRDGSVGYLCTPCAVKGIPIYLVKKSEAVIPEIVRKARRSKAQIKSDKALKSRWKEYKYWLRHKSEMLKNGVPCPPKPE